MTRGFRFAAATGLHKGDRPYQQDQVLVLDHPRSSGCLLAVVADGMGGRSGGRKASDQVLMTARQLFVRYRPGHDEPAAMLRQLLDDAHMVIKLTALSSEQEPHSTLAAFLVTPRGESTWIHAGDSRIYHFRHGQLLRRTRDHSYVQLLLDRGEISEAEAVSHPQGNILMGCLGMTATDPPLSIEASEPLQSGDVLMACSDGLWQHFETQEMGAVLAQHPPRVAIGLLIDEARARSRGAGDNISLVVLKVAPLVEPEAGPRA